MRRLLLQELIKWSKRPSRMPLLIRGARQIGKTYVVEQFAAANFNHHVTINFELFPEYKTCFDTLQVDKIIQQLGILTGQAIIPGQTLLFLDEIQECPEAIRALRYFKEQLPELHVIGAGSLLEFALSQAQFRMPVGRVEFLYLYPMNFTEFLYALGEDQLVDFLKNVSLTDTIPSALHEHGLAQARLYMLLGGMPAVLQSYLVEQDLQRVQALHMQLLATYRNDFGKYASLNAQTYCQAIFNKMPDLIAKHFKYVDVDPALDGRSLKNALNLLVKAGIVSPVKMTQATGLPLNVHVNEKKFKLLFLDLGLVKAAGKLSAEVLMNTQFLDVRSGALAEQYVGQQLLTLSPSYTEGELFYWQRDVRGAQAEVDYVIAYNEHIIPLEVKAGSAGRLRSLQMFLQEKQSPYGIKISTDPLKVEKNIIHLPIYLLNELMRLLPN